MNEFVVSKNTKGIITQKGKKLMLKGKVVLHHALKACRGSRGIVTLILNHDIRWWWGANSLLIHITSGKRVSHTH